jgi:uncharacterized protein
MRWEGREESENVEDRRGMSGRTMVAGGGIATLLLVLLVAFMGGDPSQLFQGGPEGPGGQPGGPRAVSPAEESLKKMVSVVLKDTEDVWTELFRTKLRQSYVKPKLVLFSGQTESACGLADAAMGPFYCPPEQKVFIDLAFCEELKTRFHAPGEFAVAYVLAHEVGHHVQNQLGYTDRVHGQRQALSKIEYNRLSVRLELQADYLAGVWAHHAQEMKGILEAGDVDKALDAAKAVGDDRIQKQARGRVVPDSFTHGRSEQRARWFREGFKTGDLSRLEDFFKLAYERL